MGQLRTLLVDNAADLLFNISAFIVVYVIARLFRASPIVAMSFAVLPLLVAYLMQHPANSARLVAMLP